MIRVLVRRVIYLFRLLLEEFTWIIRCVKYNNGATDKYVDLYSLMVISHVLEKGLTMPNRRLGFGQERVRQVLELCQKCIDKYGANSIEVQSTLNDLDEYNRVHQENQFILPSDIQDSLENILEHRMSNEKINSMCFTPYNFL